MAKKSNKKSASNKTTNLLDKKHRPVHGVIIGTILFLLKGISVFISVLGIVVVLVSLLVYLMRLRKSHR